VERANKVMLDFIKNMKRIFIIIIALDILLGCKPNKTNGVQSIYKTNVFKSWVSDTISFLKKSNANKNYDIILSPDSLSLEILRNYKIKNEEIGSNKIKDIQNVVLLLKEYDEIPKTNYSLSFASKYFYFPSTTSNLKYEYLFELREITTKAENETTTFNYIRGRLSGKKVVLSNGSIKKYEFNWEGTELKKVLINY
jgi:hypothetical protein